MLYERLLDLDYSSALKNPLFIDQIRAITRRGGETTIYICLCALVTVCVAVVMIPFGT